VQTASTTICLIALLLGLAVPARAHTPPESALLGDWSTEDHRGIVSIGPCGDAYCGTVVGVSDWRPDGTAVRDVNGVSECQLVIIHAMRPGGDGRRHGTVTDPRDGHVYDADLWVGDDGALRLRGYIGLPLLGSTQRWEKFAGTRQPDCHFTAAARPVESSANRH
jgi:uncharacterized protein (DUF2147 family)